MVHADPADGLTNPASWSNENRLTDASFDLEQALGLWVGDYEGLAAAGNNFDAAWAQPSGTDPDGIIFRDPPPAGETGQRDSLLSLAPGSPEVRAGSTGVGLSSSDLNGAVLFLPVRAANYVPATENGPVPLPSSLDPATVDPILAEHGSRLEDHGSTLCGCKPRGLALDAVEDLLVRSGFQA
jgi:hypothetical protein